ncbi:hypothetical protein L2734_11230 [Parashewanella spongiae]|uniref:hypothetical protein n=1 Tax=Parashewanella spongiae TaxID=342950 RepID=UPI001059BD86|nr:hypothetical protein [Parashewanella spongiae]MCL1078723.1 hypothetical protein [Parashewanella spongiae]
MIISSESGNRIQTYQDMAENCLSKYVPISEDKTIDKERFVSKAQDIYDTRSTATFTLAEHTCFGAGVEWLRCY